MLKEAKRQDGEAHSAETDICAPTSRSQDAESDGVVAAETDPCVATALNLFPGMRVATANQPAVRQPEGGWIESSTHTIDPYAPVAPTVPCRCCGAMMWGLAGSGWCCRHCHPDPRAPRADGSTNGIDPRARGVFQQAAAQGFPAAALALIHPGATVVPTEDGWRGFARTATPDELAAAAAALAAFEAEHPEWFEETDAS